LVRVVILAVLLGELAPLDAALVLIPALPRVGVQDGSLDVEPELGGIPDGTGSRVAIQEPAWSPVEQERGESLVVVQGLPVASPVWLRSLAALSGEFPVGQEQALFLAAIRESAWSPVEQEWGESLVVVQGLPVASRVWPKLSDGLRSARELLAAFPILPELPNASGLPDDSPALLLC
jgi:hypothetical protein